jgi:hypothetical protein
MVAFISASLQSGSWKRKHTFDARIEPEFFALAQERNYCRERKSRIWNNRQEAGIEQIRRIHHILIRRFAPRQGLN